MKALCHRDLPPNNLIQVTIDTRSQSKDRLVQGFLNREKVDRIQNMELLLVITVTMTNHIVAGFLVDDGSSCNIITLIHSVF